MYRVYAEKERVGISFWCSQ